jgi:two-component system, sensor histidine kinase and response regulator
MSAHRGNSNQYGGDSPQGESDPLIGGSFQLNDALRATDIIEPMDLGTRDVSDGMVPSQRVDELSDELQNVVSSSHALNRYKNQFLANVSHELRTPLNGVIGLTDLVLDSQLDPLQREYLETVKSSSKGLLQVISDLLDFSQMDSGGFKLVSVQFDLREQLVATLKTLAIRAHQKGLEFIYDIDADVSAMVVGDSRRLLQVVSNIVGNAVKFTENGEIFLRVSVLKQGESETTLSFSVRDTGIGIAPEQEASIFNAFSQADESTTREHGGTGLGLTLSSQLVQLMRGKMTVESRLGRGSTFTFSASFGDTQQSTRRNQALSDDWQGREVLVVDNNRQSLELTGRHLRSLGLEPTLVDEGSEAIKKLDDGTESGTAWPLVLIDDRMPGMHGFVVAEIIKQEPSLAKSTIMLISPGDRRSLQGRLVQGFNRLEAEAAIREQLSDTVRTLSSLERCKKMGFPCVLKPFDSLDLARAFAELDSDKQGADESSSAGRSHATNSKKTYRVLVAEDNHINQMLAVKLLQREGYEVMVANNGREALEAVSEEMFDLVLMDIQMPEMDGREATVAIRKLEHAGHAEVPIIALTAHDLESDRIKCFESGMNGFATKPIRPKALFAEISRVLDLDDPGSSCPL